MRGLSEDLRARIVRRYESGKNAGEVASHFEVSVRSVYRYISLARAGQNLAPRAVGGSRSIMERENLQETLRGLVEADSEASLRVYAERLQAQTGVTMSTPSVCRALQRLGLTRKKRPSNLKNVMKPSD